MIINFLLLMVCGVFISSISQILLKKSAQNNIEEKRFLKQYLNRLVVTGYLLLFIAMLIPFYTLRVVPLKYSAVIESLGYGFIMVLSAWLLKEKITKRKILGNIIIILGVIVFSFS